MANRQFTRDELEAMTKDELQGEAESRGLTVTRGDGEDGAPLKADYVEALASTSGSASTGTPAAQAKGASKTPRLDETVPGGKYIVESGDTVNADGKVLKKASESEE